MWMGEQITEFGIGNGISIILFAGILSRVPTMVSQMVDGFRAGTLKLSLIHILNEMKATEVRAMSVEQLNEKLTSLKKDLFFLRMQPPCWAICWPWCWRCVIRASVTCISCSR